MNSLVASLAGLAPLAPLALETLLLALVVAFLRRWNRSAAWSRACCQAGIAAVLVLTGAELSGLGRSAAGWVTGWFARTQVVLTPIAKPSPQSAPVSGPTTAPQEQRFERSVEPAASQPAMAYSGPVQRVSPTPSAPEPEPATDAGVVRWLGLVWAAGALAGLARLGLMRLVWCLFHLRRRTQPDPLLVARVQELARALGMKRRVRVVQWARLHSPVAFGWLRPTVGLPLDFATRFDAPGQEAILAHEVAHLAAYDPCWCFLADMALATLWWHPAVWWLRRQLHSASELVADEASLLVADGPEALAQCLVELGASLSRRVVSGPLGVASFRSHLGRRVQRLLHLEARVWSPPRRLRLALFRILGAMAMVAMALVSTAWATPRALTQGEPMNWMSFNWKHPLATVTVLAALNGPQATAATAEPNPPAPAAAPAANAVEATPANPASPAVPAQPAAVPPVPATQAAPPPAPSDSPAGAALEAKLKHLRMSEVLFTDLPLSEVLKYLSDQSVALDPEKVGVNFLLNPNAPSVPQPAIDPATGLPMPVPAESVDISQVVIKFNLPLRHVTMKDVLDAVVKVADHPIEYSLEDYAVVFSLKPQTFAAQHVVLNHLQTLARPAPGMAAPQPQPAPEQPEEPVSATPKRFNIDFGKWRPEESEQVGPAAAGEPGDFWNTVGVAWNNAHTEFGMHCADHSWSPIRVEMLNLAGGWGNNGCMGVKAPMLDCYNYPMNNQGGDAQVILHRVPAGKYQVFIYGHGKDPHNYGDYTLQVGKHNYGRKSTSHKADAVENTKWVEGSQYVKFSNVNVGPGEDLQILIRPGEPFVTPDGRKVADAMICGLQLIPVK